MGIHFAGLFMAGVLDDIEALILIDPGICTVLGARNDMNNTFTPGFYTPNAVCAS